MTQPPVIDLEHADDAIAAEINELMLAAYRVEAALLGVSRFVPLERTVAHVASSPSRFVGMRADGALVAVAELEDEATGATNIASLVVRPSHFRRGLARALLGSIATRTPGALTVSTAAANEPALRLYGHAGFRTVRRWSTPDGIAMVSLRCESSPRDRFEIVYRDDVALDAATAIDLYRRSTLGARRPVDRPDIFEQMLRHANLTITAWRGDTLVGIARSLTDHAFVAYLADLAVDAAVQRRGIGRRLIDETRRRLWPECRIVLLAAPDANDYYPRLGFEHNPRAWVLAGRPAAGSARPTDAPAPEIRRTPLPPGDLP